jgi:poly(3-hydroxybutyrate) depolymerase
VLTRFAVDPDHVYVTGLSQTGYWAWFLGAFRADRFAGIAPMWNGRSAHKGVVKPSAATLLEIAGEKCDWTATFEAAVTLRR